MEGGGGGLLGDERSDVATVVGGGFAFEMQEDRHHGYCSHDPSLIDRADVIFDMAIR